LLAPGIVDQNTAHGLGCGRKEVAAVVPRLRAFFIDEPDVRFMHQRCGVERLSRPLARQLLGRQLPQLFVNEREEVASRLRVALFNRIKDSRYVVHHTKAYSAPFELSASKKSFDRSRRNAFGAKFLIPVSGGSISASKFPRHICRFPGISNVFPDKPKYHR
jgi:hypothetical protein